jgi:hypothetical protein
MRFSEGRQSYLAHRILGILTEEGLADVENAKHVLAEVKRVLNRDHDEEVRIDAVVRRKIASLSRDVPPGSREWDVLYHRYFHEEQRRKKAG